MTTKSNQFSFQSRLHFISAITFESFCFRPLPNVQRALAGERGVPNALQLLADAAQGPLPVVPNARAQSDQLDGRRLSRGRGQPTEHVGRHPLIERLSTVTVLSVD